MRSVRESMQVKMLEIEADYTVLNALLPWLTMNCTNTRHFIPNTHLSPRMPEEIVKGALALDNKYWSTQTTYPQTEYAIALGRVIGTTGAVRLYRMDASRVMSRHVIKAVLMTEQWRQHLNELAKQRPIDSATFFEFKSTLAYGPENQEDVKRVTVQSSKRRSMIQPQSVQSNPKPIPAEIVQPVQAPSPVTTSISSSSPRIPVSPMSQRASPNPPPSPMSPVNPRPVSTRCS
jgi:hypothetical protein